MLTVNQTVEVPPADVSEVSADNPQFLPGTYGTNVFRFFDVGTRDTYTTGPEIKFDKKFVYLSAAKGNYVHFYGAIADYAGSAKWSDYDEVSQYETAIDATQDVDLGALDAAQIVKVEFHNTNPFGLANKVTATFMVERVR